nr:hypothetical protein AEK19_MT0885 [Ipomoea trifida]
MVVSSETPSRDSGSLPSQSGYVQKIITLQMVITGFTLGRDPNIGLLYLFAISSLGVYGIIIAEAKVETFDRNIQLSTDKAGTSTANEGWPGPGSQG